MKNLKSIIAIIAISLATTFSTTATEKEPTKITKKLRTEIVSMLGNNVKLDIKNSSKAEVSFMINSKNEIVVVNVDSKVNEFNSYVKSKLNYKKLTLQGVTKGKIYRMPIKLKKE